MERERQRLDKWLWFARFAKTRTLAAKLVSEGYVRVNGKRVDTPSRAVGAGDVLTVAAPHRTVVVKVILPGVRRGPAPEARGLYEEIGPDPGGSRDDAALVSEPGKG